VYTGVAVAATGIAVSSGVLATDEASSGVRARALSSFEVDHTDEAPGDEAPPDDVLVGRESGASRSAGRGRLDPVKQRALSQDSGGQVTRTEDLTGQDPRSIARALLADYGFSGSEFGCLDALWVSESDWDVNADNPTSSAYGIPQALTGGTHQLPADYMTNPVSQIRWGLEYIRDSYGSPCSAWAFKQGHNWY
jgi:hypothetical protein